MCVGLVVASALLGGRPVSAHGGQPGIEVLPSQARAGESVLLYGEDLDPGVAISVALLAADGERLLGTFESDHERHLVAEVTLPDDLAPRPYKLRLTTDTGLALSTLITVAGTNDAAGLPVPALFAVAAAGLGAAIIAALLLRRREGKP